MIDQRRGFSSSAAVRAVAWNTSPCTRTSTSGFAERLWYQFGCRRRATLRRDEQEIVAVTPEDQRRGSGRRRSCDRWS
jgi:hypothetical protein